MKLLLVLLALGLLLFVIGFVVKVVWIAALVVLVIWLVFFLGRGRERASWYRR